MSSALAASTRRTTNPAQAALGLGPAPGNPRAQRDQYNPAARDASTACTVRFVTNPDARDLSSTLVVDAQLKYPFDRPSRAHTRDPVDVVQAERHLGHPHKTRLASMATPPNPPRMEYEYRNYRWAHEPSPYELGVRTMGIHEAECVVAAALDPTAHNAHCLDALRAFQLQEERKRAGWI